MTDFFSWRSKNCTFFATKNTDIKGIYQHDLALLFGASMATVFSTFKLTAKTKSVKY